MRVVLAMLVCALSVACANAEQGIFSSKDVQKHFSTFVQKFKKSYQTSALVSKLSVFQRNLEFIAAKNAASAAKRKGRHVYAVNFLADMSAEEFKAKLLTLRAPPKRSLIEMRLANEANTENYEALEYLHGEMSSMLEQEAEQENDDKKKKEAAAKAAAAKKAAAAAAAKKKAAAAAAAKKKEEEAAAARERAAADAKAAAAAAEASQKAETDAAIARGEIPKFFDLRNRNVLTPIKYQGGCGSCWAFTAIASIESAAAAKFKTPPVAFSEQHILDCTAAAGDAYDGLKGCKGGWYDTVYRFVKDTSKGVVFESDYPYKTAVGAVCEDKPKVPGTTVTGFNYVAPGEASFQKALIAANSAISIALDAKELQFFSKGYYGENSTDCGLEKVTHGVNLVGWGEETHETDPSQGLQHYWVIRNSWHTWWGDKGYFKLHRIPASVSANTDDQIPCGAGRHGTIPTVA